MSIAEDYRIVAEASIMHLPLTDPAVAAALHDLRQEHEVERLVAEGRLP